LKILFLVIAATLCCPSVLDAQRLATDKTTGEFLKICEFVLNDKKPPTNYEVAYLNTGICVGYIAGVLDSIPVLQFGGEKKLISLPTSGIQNERVLELVLQQVKKDPSLLKESIRSIMFASIRAEYHCQ